MNSVVSLRCIQVQLECAGLLQTLFVVTGSCQGLEIGLDVESVSFGAVVQNSSSTRQFILNNTGDIGARFISFSLSFFSAPPSGRNLFLQTSCGLIRIHLSILHVSLYVLHCFILMLCLQKS